MGFHKSKLLSEYNLSKPKFYLRYVNNIAATFHNQQDSLNFLSLLNNRYSNIKFTIYYNNWNSFHNDKENIKSNLIKNAYPSFFINKIIKKYVDYKFSSNWNQSKDKSHVHYIKLQYIGNPSHHIKINLSKLCNDFCKENFNIKLVFNSFRFESYCWYKFLMIWNFSSI